LQAVLHLAWKELQVEGKAVILQPPYIGAHFRIDHLIRRRSEAESWRFMPMQLHAHAAQERICDQPVELGAHIIGGHVSIADERVRPAGTGSDLGNERYLPFKVLPRPVRLDVDALFDA